MSSEREVITANDVGTIEVHAVASMSSAASMGGKPNAKKINEAMSAAVLKACEDGYSISDPDHVPKIKEYMMKAREAAVLAIRNGALLLLVLLGTTFSAEAQSLTTVFQLRVYAEGATSPVTTYDIPVANVQCGQSKVAAPATVYNPRVVRWDDELNPTGMDCVWNDPGTGPLLGLPLSTTIVYRARIVATDPIGTSPESAPSNPFSRRGLPAAPTGLRLTPGQ